MRKLFSNSEKRDLNSIISIFSLSVSKKDKVELVEDESRIILVNSRPEFFYHEEDILPTLKVILDKNLTLKRVVVDMGAIKFVTSGADIMRPGITRFDEFEKDDFVIIVDETHGKPLALGQVLFSSEELKSIEKGKVIKNLHFVGDKIWNA